MRLAQAGNGNALSLQSIAYNLEIRQTLLKLSAFICVYLLEICGGSKLDLNSNHRAKKRSPIHRLHPPPAPNNRPHTQLPNPPS